VDETGRTTRGELVFMFWISWCALVDYTTLILTLTSIILHQVVAIEESNKN